MVNYSSTSAAKLSGLQLLGVLVIVVNAGWWATGYSTRYPSIHLMSLIECPLSKNSTK